ncbi:MAG TPA: PP2C family protein-serine/threonine phosphatase [Thermoanaerobaculia bacterium]|nr:PP2C family protein-serine/threonine phosphatase [Thermoanaerobaculia bacterium]
MMLPPMRRGVFAAAGLTGAGLLAVLIPLYDAPQPRGLNVTRSRVREIADAEARAWGIPVDRAFVVTTLDDSLLLEKELRDKPDLRRRADADPVLGPRLFAFRVTYWRNGVDKFPPWGEVAVSRTGQVLAVRRQARQEASGASPKAEDLRPKADAFVASRVFPGAPGPVYEEARPTVMRARTDHTFRYRVPSTFPTGDVVFYLYVNFTGDAPSGYALAEEYKDGRRFAFDTNVGATFLRFAEIFTLLFILLAVFLKKYHAGEVGVRTGAVLFAVAIVLCLAASALTAGWAATGTSLGSADMRTTTFAVAGFRLLFYDIPLSVLVFLAWSVGESVARERWGDRLASFDAVLRRDPVNATVGGSLLAGLLASPAVAAAALLVPALGLRSGAVWARLGTGSSEALNAVAGPLAAVLSAALDALLFSCVGLLFLLATFHRKRLLALGVALAAAFGLLMGIVSPPVGPLGPALLVGFGGIAAVLLAFAGSDLLAAATTAFGGGLLVCLLPLVAVASGPARTGPLLALALPLSGIALLAAAGLGTKRRVAYGYEDLAPHVKRIVERERIKAEIDAANRIQAALLPSVHPELGTASVVSHYRAATEIGGDYFDFLPLPQGRLGLAFGDVAGHGLTSGIVMSMTKAALLVQVRHDASPVRVLEVLNDIVMRTAPKRMLMTFFFGVLDPETSTLRFASAGHLDPYVFRARERRLELLSAWGFPLGVRRREPFHESVVRFEPGDRLILYSDGLIEALNDDGEPFGFERFEGVILSRGERSADVLKVALLESVKSFTRNRPPEDDQTLVVVSFEERPAVALRAS